MQREVHACPARWFADEAMKAFIATNGPEQASSMLAMRGQFEPRERLLQPSLVF